MPTWPRDGATSTSPTASSRCAGYRDFLADNAESIAAFRQQQAVAFAAERQAWDRAGEFRRAIAEQRCSPSCGTLSTAH